jgi:hypothetical protein
MTLNSEIIMDKENENIEFNDFMFLALDHAFECIENNASPLIPFTMTKNLGGENLSTATYVIGLRKALNERNNLLKTHDQI